jgi:DNA-binding transcriptional ArsR family regulator
VQPFDVLGNPVRRRILELLAEGARTSGEIVEAIQREFDISQPGVSQHLRVLRDTNFASSRVDGQRRIYELAGPPLAEVDAWLDRLRGAWAARLDALATEIARGQRERRLAEPRKTTARRRA